MSLQIKNLHTTVDTTEILHGVNLEIEKGQVHVLMGPNGSGKSTLANTLMGHPKYSVTAGSAQIDDVELLDLKPNERAVAGLFLSLQYPPEVQGVTISNFLRAAVEGITGEKQHPITFYKQLQKTMQTIGIGPEFAGRPVNVGFSGGEKKKMEMLQLMVLSPRYAILDETDSGLDVDALKIVANGINQFRSPETSVLLITHYNRILQYVTPDMVHIMVDGQIIASGDATLAKEIEEQGYTGYIV